MLMGLLDVGLLASRELTDWHKMWREWITPHAAE
jgi:hypothetical protein